MPRRWLFLGLILLAVLFEVISDALFKHWSDTNKTAWMIVGLVLYVASTVFWAFSLKHEDLSKAITVFTVTNLIAVLAVGRFFFHETLSLQAKIGVAFGVIGIALMEME